ncbi:MAG: exosortase A [Gammaproteobacteria bacterium]|nr:exosortase A [Gammaproteobacteria bacterium]
MIRNSETGSNNIPGAEDVTASWRFPAAIALLAVSIFIAIYHATAWSMITVWAESDTFAHGFLIFPISAFLVWRKRHELTMVQPVPVRYGPAVLVIPGLCWLLGYVSDIQVIQQFCFVATIILLVWILLGWKVVKLLAFPLAFLLFAVPFGKFLVPSMIDFSASFAIGALRLTGVPVYADGASFSTPGTNWKVVEVCSGMRYLIAALVVGTLYAYMNYQSLKRRLLFVLITIVVTLFASGMRVYIIVMLGHFVDMRYAKGFDHLFIGWVFFGVVVLLLFWIGSFWREDTGEDRAGYAAVTLAGQGQTVRKPEWAMIGAFSLLVIAVWPVLGSWVQARAESDMDVSLQVPAASAGWSLSPDLVDDWKPHYTGYDVEVSQTYQKDGRRIGVYLLYYKAQRQGAELVNSRNRIVKSGKWRKVADTEQKPVRAPGLAIDVMKTKLYSAKRELLVYNWNWFDGQYIFSPYMAKLMELKSKLLGRQLPGAAIVIFTDYREEGEVAEQALQSFIADMLPAIEYELNEAANQNGQLE